MRYPRPLAEIAGLEVLVNGACDVEAPAQHARLAAGVGHHDIPVSLSNSQEVEGTGDLATRDDGDAHARDRQLPCLRKLGGCSRFEALPADCDIDHAIVATRIRVDAGHDNVRHLLDVGPGVAAGAILGASYRDRDLMVTGSGGSRPRRLGKRRVVEAAGSTGPLVVQVVPEAVKCADAADHVTIWADRIGAPAGAGGDGDGMHTGQRREAYIVKPYRARRISEHIPVLPLEGVGPCCDFVLNGESVPFGEAGPFANGFAVYVEDEQTAGAGELPEEAQAARQAVQCDLQGARPARGHRAGPGRVGAGVAVCAGDGPHGVPVRDPRPLAEVAGLKVLVHRPHHVETFG